MFRKSTLASAILLSAAVFATLSTAQAETIYNGMIYPGENWISVPAEPYDAAPALVFEDVPINGSLTRRDPATQAQIVYNAADPSLFGDVARGVGYSLNFTGTEPMRVSFKGTDDRLFGKVRVRLYHGENWIGTPWNHSIDFASIYLNDGTQYVPISQAINMGWLMPDWIGLDPVYQAAFTVSLPEFFPSSSRLEPWHMYKVFVNSPPYLEVVMRASTDEPIPEPSSLVTLGSGCMACLGAYARRRQRR